MRSKNFIIAPALLFCALTLLPSCAKVDDMHDATMKMSATTTDLAKTTADTKKAICEVFDTGRQGAALDLRNKLFSEISSAPKIEDKATNAGLFFLAFEFQLWSENCIDENKGQREVLMRDAVDEFFCHLLGITHWDDVDPFAGKNLFASKSTENEKMAFNALALTLERNNRKQLAVTAASGRETLSMLSMIETALLAGQSIREGKSKLSDYPAYVDVVLSHEATAMRLLQARYQMLGLVVLTQLTPIAKNNVEGFKYKIWGSSWNIDFQKLNQSELRLASFRLSEANRARETLAKLGVQVELNSSLKKIYANAEMKNFAGDKAEGQTQTAAEDGRVVTAEAAATQEEFVTALNQYLGK